MPLHTSSQVFPSLGTRHNGDRDTHVTHILHAMDTYARREQNAPKFTPLQGEAAQQVSVSQPTGSEWRSVVQGSLADM